MELDPAGQPEHEHAERLAAVGQLDDRLLLTAFDAAQAVGGATIGFFPTTFCTIRVCPSRTCSLTCPM